MPLWHFSSFVVLAFIDNPLDSNTQYKTQKEKFTYVQGTRAIFQPLYQVAYQPKAIYDFAYQSRYGFV